MALDLLDTPLRVTWDLHDGRTGMPSSLAHLVAEQLVAAQVFYLTLDLHPLLHPDAVAVIRRLSASGCQVEIATGPDAAELARLPELPPALPVLLDVAPFCTAEGLDRQGLSAALAPFHARTLMPVFCLVPTRANLHLLGTLFAFCRDVGVSRFKLPNLRINDTFRQISQPSMVTPDALAQLRAEVGDASRFRCGLELDVHDLFLWEVLFPDGGAARSEYGGCQAANSLAHVDVRAVVHPCNSWPQPLGSLATESFAAIWQSAARHAVRAQIAQPPVGCAGCRDYPVCFGGCRGLARELPTADGRDPMCDNCR